MNKHIGKKCLVTAVCFVFCILAGTRAVKAIELPFVPVEDDTTTSAELTTRETVQQPETTKSSSDKQEQETTAPVKVNPVTDTPVEVVDGQKKIDIIAEQPDEGVTTTAPEKGQESGQQPENRQTESRKTETGQQEKTEKPADEQNKSDRKTEQKDESEQKDEKIKKEQKAAKTPETEKKDVDTKSGKEQSGIVSTVLIVLGVVCLFGAAAAVIVKKRK